MRACSQKYDHQRRLSRAHCRHQVFLLNCGHSLIRQTGCLIFSFFLFCSSSLILKLFMAEGEGWSKGIARNPLYAQTHKLEPPSPIMAVWSRVVALGPAVVLTGRYRLEPTWSKRSRESPPDAPRSSRSGAWCVSACLVPPGHHSRRVCFQSCAAPVVCPPQRSDITIYDARTKKKPPKKESWRAVRKCLSERCIR